jgi:hypothetical protein
LLIKKRTSPKISNVSISSICNKSPEDFPEPNYSKNRSEKKAETSK